MAAADGEHADDVWDRPVVCEVCGCDAADSVIMYCCNYGEDHQVGCHTFCLAGHGYRGRRQDTYECLACLDYSRSVNDAVGKAQAGDKASPEFMPELRQVQLGLRVRHAHEAVPHTTEQQRIDQAKAAAEAAAAAAKAAKSRRAAAMDAGADADADAEQAQYGQLPSKRRKAAGAASGRLAQGGKVGQRGAAEGAGTLHRLGSGAAAAAAGAAGVGAGEEQGPQGRVVRQRHGAVQEFIKGVNRGMPKDVRQAQGKAKAAAAAAAAGGRRGAAGRGRGRSRGRLQAQQRQRAAAAAAEADDDVDDTSSHSGPGPSEEDPDDVGGWQQEWHDEGQDEAADDTAAAAAAAAAAGGGRGARRQQQQQRPQQLAGLRLGRHHKLALPVEPIAFDRKLFDAKLHCRLVVMSRGQQQQPLRHQDVVDADHYLHVSGVFWANSQVEEEVEGEQQAAHRQLLDDMVQELAKGSGFMQGGAFDLSSHPAIQRYMESPHLTYRPLLFIPNSDTDKSMVQDLLSEPRRFVVVSIETKLLVLLPTTSNGMVAICARRVAQSEDLTADVVKTIMAHPGLACPSQDAEGAHQQLQSPSESLLGPAGAEPPAGPEPEDTKEGVATCEPPAAASPKQQQEQHRAQQELSHAAGASGVAGQRLGKGLRTSMRAASARTAEGAAAALAAAAAARPGAPAARAAAAAAAAGGTPSGGLSLAEAVEGSPLAQLLRRVGQGAAGAAAAAGQQQQGLSLQACMPQLEDLPEVQHIKLFMLGFPQAALQEGGCLHAPLQAAAKVVAEVHTSTGALDDLLQHLHLGAFCPCSLPAAARTAGATATAAAGGGGGGARAGGRRAANAAGPSEVPREDSCCRVLLVPEHFDSHALQQLLGDVPLWQLLASPVAVFKQGPHRGILQELQRLHEQQPNAAAAGVASRVTPGRRQQQAGAVRSSSRLPPGVVLTTQCHSDELAVVADASTLGHCPAEDLQQLLRLLEHAQALLGARQGAGDAAGLAAAGGSAYLVLSGQDLESLGEQQQELLRAGLTNNTVVLLEDILHPTDNDGGAGTAADHDSDPVVAAAVKLAAQRQQQQRHVVVVAPDIGSGPPSSGQAQSPSVSGGAAAKSAPAASAASPPKGAAAAAGGRSTPAAASKGGSRGAGGVSGGASAQRPPGASYADRVVARCRLQASAQQPRLLAGTLGQTLQFLTCLVGNSSNVGGQ